MASGLPTASSPAPLLPTQLAAPRCPFHDGAETLDLLLGELDRSSPQLLDAVLDLRSLFAAGDDAAACVMQLFRVRALLEERHYLAFFRVRCWTRRALRIAVRADRHSPWHYREIPLNGARFDEIINAAIATLADRHGVIPSGAHARFVFAPDA